MPAKTKPATKKAATTLPSGGILRPAQVWHSPTAPPAKDGEVDIVFYRRAVEEKPEVIEALEAKGLLPRDITAHQAVLNLIATAPAPALPAATKAPPPAAPMTYLPKQARSHPSLEWWLSQPDNAIRLKQILADPVFVAACHYVEGTINVTPDDLVGSKAALDEVIVRKAAMAAGIRIFTATLAALPDFRKQQATDTPQPWEYIQAPIR